MSIKLKFKTKLNTRSLSQLIEKLHNLEEQAAVAGFRDDQIHPRSKETAVFIAEINNEGGSQYSEVTKGIVDIPARPFMDYAVDYEERSVNSISSSQIEKFIYDQASVQQTLKPIAAKLKDAIEWALLSETLYEANRDLTIKLKGEDRPLYETGWLSSHIKIWVDEKEQE